MITFNCLLSSLKAETELPLGILNGVEVLSAVFWFIMSVATAMIALMQKAIYKNRANTVTYDIISLSLHVCDVTRYFRLLGNKASF